MSADPPARPYAQAAPAIYDLGFQHYDGERLDSWYATRTLLWDTYRGAFGLGRSARAKIMPVLLVVLVTVPTVIIGAVAVFADLDELPVSGSQYVTGVSLLTTLFVASQAPQAVSRDLRHRTISLYLSRPQSRGEYVLAKAVALVAATLTFLVLPVTVLHAGGLLAKLSVRDQISGWLEGVVTAGLYAVLLGLLALAICAWVVRRGFGVAAVVVALFLSVVVAGILAGVIAYDSDPTGETAPAVAVLALALAPLSLVDGLRSWILGERLDDALIPHTTALGTAYVVVYVVIVVLSLLALLWRYRTVSVS
jgi:ABC-2 type transport system permease protein